MADFVDKDDLASVAHSKGASMVGLEDASGRIVADNVEDALQEIVTSVAAATSDIGQKATSSQLLSEAHGAGASLIGIEDPTNKFAGGNVESALSELANKEVNHETRISTNESDIGIIFSEIGLKQTSAELASNAHGSGAALIGIQDAGSLLTATTVEGALQELALSGGGGGGGDVTLAALASHAPGQGASLIGIQDVGGLITATQTEAALAEIVTKANTGIAAAATAQTAANSAQSTASTALTNAATAQSTANTANSAAATAQSTANLAAPSADLASTLINKGASLIGIHDTGSLITATTVEGALAEEATNIATNTSNISSNTTAIALRPLTTDLASNANGKGASMVGIEDSGALITATTVEGALAEIATKSPPVGYFAAHAGLHNMYVAPYGNDLSDGFDWRTPKKYIMTAINALLPLGGTVHIMDGSYCGGPVQGQGIWLAGGVTGNPEWGFADLSLHPSFNLIGYNAGLGFVQQAFPGARIFPGKETDVSTPSDRRQVGLWVTNNAGSPVYAFGLSFKDEFPIGIRLGCTPDPAADPDVIRGSDFTTATVRIAQCAVERDSDHGRDAGPCIDMGYCLWTNIEDCSLIASTDAARSSDRRACILVKPSDGSTQLRVYRCRGANGGIIYYNGPSTWGFEVRGWDIEGPAVLPPAFWAKGLGSAGSGFLDSIHQNDAAFGSDDNIVIEDDNHSMTPTQIVVVASSRSVVGPATIFGNEGQAGGSVSNNGETLAGRGGFGFANNKIIGDHDGHRFSEPVFSNRFRNLIPQLSGATGETGSVIDQPNGSSSTRLTGRHGAVVAGVLGTWVNADVKDHRGGVDAWKLDSTTGSPTTNFLFQGVDTYADGDTFIFGIWVRFPNGLSLSQSTWGRIGLTQSGGGGITRRRNINDNGDIILNDYGNTEWQWYSGWVQKVSNNGGSGTWTSNFTIIATQANPVIYDGAAMIRVNVANEDNNEIAAIQQAMKSYLQIPAGAGATTALYQKLLAQGGLGVGNSASGTTLGTVIKKMEIFDGSGVSLGFVPIYDTIT